MSNNKDSNNVLILLIGSNPLPNYVVAKYLKDSNRSYKEELPIPNKFIFVCSNDTKKFADILKDKLVLSKDDFYIANIGENERNFEEIKEKINLMLNEIYSIDSIHINYTGGTKPMAVHSYNSILERLDGNLYFSDLDPKNFKLSVLKKLKNDKEISKLGDYPKEKDLRSFIKLSPEDIITLHDMKITHNGVNKSIFKTFLSDILSKRLDYEKLDKKDKENTWFNKFEKEDKEKPKKLKDLHFQIEKKRTRESLSPQEIDNYINFEIKDWLNVLNTKSFFKGLKDEFPSMRSLFDENDNFIENNFYYFWSFFRGVWLEDFILEKLNFLKESQKINFDYIRKGLEVKYKNKTSEIDLIVTKGYEMFLISVTTSSYESTIKQKIFEAIYRGEQLGGGHCKVVSVSLASNESLLKDELQQFDADKNCHLITKNDIKNNLEKKLIDIIKK